MRVKIEIDGTRKRIWVEIGGEMVPLKRVTQASLNLGDPGDLARFELELIPSTVEIDGDVQLDLSEDTRALLLANGWTEPPK